MAKLLENSHAWLGASTSSIADSYQYQLQSMWQKCWNTNQSLVHNLRFRERGPLKSWRPETMAEAIFSVLKEGLSLSQAARKYDIPYPTFVLYANRVHNMLGPSADGGADLRPKGRGRPQRILLGVWPDEHIRGVIRTVVFRDHQHIKEEAHLQYARLPDGLSVQNYATGSCSNGPGPEPTVSPGAAAAAAVAAVAQGLRQQMCSMVAAAQHHPDHGQVAGLVGGLSLGHCASMGLGHGGLPHRLGSPVGSAHDLRMTSPEESPLASPLELALEPAVNLAVGGTVEVGIGVSGMAYKQSRGFTSPRPEHLFQEDIADLVSPSRASTPTRLAMGLKDRSPPIKMESLAECRGD